MLIFRKIGTTIGEIVYYALLAEERIREAADIPNLLSTSINVVVSRAKGIFTFGILEEQKMIQYEKQK